MYLEDRLLNVSSGTDCILDRPFVLLYVLLPVECVIGEDPTELLLVA